MKAKENVAKNVETKSVRSELEQRFGQVAYKLSKKQDEMRRLSQEEQALQGELTNLTSKIEKL